MRLLGPDLVLFASNKASASLGKMVASGEAMMQGLDRGGCKNETRFWDTPWKLEG